MTNPDAGAREALMLVNGEWVAKCGCKLHYFDGQGTASDELSDGTRFLRGKVSPHWHKCPAHQRLKRLVLLETRYAIAVGLMRRLMDAQRDGIPGEDELAPYREYVAARKAMQLFLKDEPAHQQPAPATDALLMCPEPGCKNMVTVEIDTNPVDGGVSFHAPCEDEHNLNDDGQNYWILWGRYSQHAKTAAHYKAKVRDLENEIKRLHQASTTAKGQRADSEAWGRAMNDRREQAETERDRCKQRLREANGLLKSILYHDERGQGVGYAETMQQARAHLAKETPHDPQ